MLHYSDVALVAIARFNISLFDAPRFNVARSNIALFIVPLFKVALG